MKQDRVKIDKGISIYRRHRQWWLDDRRGGLRSRTPLHTDESVEALKRALRTRICDGIRYDLRVDFVRFGRTSPSTGTLHGTDR